MTCKYAISYKILGTPERNLVAAHQCAAAYWLRNTVLKTWIILDIDPGNSIRTGDIFWDGVCDRNITQA
jgi:hypothetical protein